jgi:type II secretory ATPase GspE/PulE/Tfp pilus assembly ATPase PilB-like protein
MRDSETAKTAIEAYLTGHLVFSTLHTNSAPETVVRLIQMGVDPLNFADALLGILAQRLPRRLCNNCKAPYHPEKEEYDIYVREYGEDLFAQDKLDKYSEDFTLMKKVGCDVCNSSGYKGRLMICELLVGTPQVKKAISTEASAAEIKQLAISEGMRTIKMDGIYKVIEGITDFESVKKVSL